jgi:hypothetical protein
VDAARRRPAAEDWRQEPALGRRAVVVAGAVPVAGRVAPSCGRDVVAGREDRFLAGAGARLPPAWPAGSGRGVPVRAPEADGAREPPPMGAGSGRGDRESWASAAGAVASTAAAISAPAHFSGAVAPTTTASG